MNKFIDELYSSIKDDGSIDYENILNSLIQHTDLTRKQALQLKKDPKTRFLFTNPPKMRIPPASIKEMTREQHKLHNLTDKSKNSNDLLIEKMISIVKEETDLALLIKMMLLSSKNPTKNRSIESNELLSFLQNEGDKIKGRITKFKKNDYVPSPAIAPVSAETSKAVESNLSTIYSEQKANHQEEDGIIEVATESAVFGDEALMINSILLGLMNSEVSLNRGLFDSDVEYQRLQFGWNESVSPVPSISIFSKFANQPAILLELTSLISIILRKYDVAIIVILLLLFNNFVAIIQEMKANEALLSLLDKLQLFAKVLRNDQWNLKLPAKELVPNDILRIRMGDMVPADCLIRLGSVLADYSAITGESNQLLLQVNDEVLSGALIVSGEITCQVIRTGKRTNYGQTVSLISSSAPKSHTEFLVSRITTYLSLFLGSCLLIACFVLLMRESNLSRILGLIPLLLLLLTSSIPVGLPTMMAMSTTLGSVELTKVGVLTTRLDAILDAARMDILCCDKTGTITENKLCICEIESYQNGWQDDDIVRLSLFACQYANKDPIDSAFYDYQTKIEPTEKINTGPFENAEGHLIRLSEALAIEFIPFDPSERRFTTCILRLPSKMTLIVIKGSVEDVMMFCALTSLVESRIKISLQKWAKRGFRSIAVASTISSAYQTDNDSNLIDLQRVKFDFVGLIGLSDPPRPDSRRHISAIKELGINVVMLTGDALPIAQEVGELVGLKKTRIYSMTQLGQREDLLLESGLPETEFVGGDIDGVAQVLPQDKHSIIRGFQGLNHVAGMTGDGVNDAPALKMAEVGIAVKSATDIAKKAASFILTQPGLNGISDIILTGRRMHHRIITWIINKLVKSCLTVIYILLMYLAFDFFVVESLHMVILLVLVDFLTLSLTFDPVRNRDAVHQTSLLLPQKYHFKEVLLLGAGLGLLSISEILAFILIVCQCDFTKDTMKLQTMHVELLYFFAACTVFSVRERSWFWKSFPSLWMLVPIFISTLALIFVGEYGNAFLRLGHVSISESLFMLGYAFVFVFGVNDSFKSLFLIWNGL